MVDDLGVQHVRQHREEERLLRVVSGSLRGHPNLCLPHPLGVPRHSGLGLLHPDAQRGHRVLPFLVHPLEPIYLLPLLLLYPIEDG